MLTLCNSDGDGEVQEGSNAVIGLPINTSTGDGSLESTGVALRSSILDDLLDGLHLPLCVRVGTVGTWGMR